jgi:hypothetical protein
VPYAPRSFDRLKTPQLADFRRSGVAEAVSGDITPAKLSSKMANTISTSNKLHRTYSPQKLSDVRDADDARRRGRSKLREQKPAESVMAPDQKCQAAVQVNLSH